MRYAAIALLLACSTKTPPAALSWVADEKQAFERARAERKGVMVEFYASWSAPSDELELKLKANAATIEKRFVPLRIDVSDESPATTAIRERYDAKELPSVVWVTATGTELGRLRMLPDEGELASILDKVTR